MKVHSIKIKEDRGGGVYFNLLLNLYMQRPVLMQKGWARHNLGGCCCPLTNDDHAYDYDLIAPKSTHIQNSPQPSNQNFGKYIFNSDGGHGFLGKKK